MRIVKEASERRKEILDAADELFGIKGFDATSTADILERVKIARGTLYYHFKSKEDIMDALIERYNDQLLSGARKIASDKSMPVGDRIVRTVQSLNLKGKSDAVIMEHIHKPQNALMHQKIEKMVLKEVTPILTGIIQDGISEGLFNTPFPYECMEMVISYLDTVFDEEMVELTQQELMTRVEAFIYNLERLLGVEEGRLNYVRQIFGM